MQFPELRAAHRKTAITVGMHLVGTLSRSLGFAIEPVIEKATRGFFEELRKECETAAKEADKLQSEKPSP
jgi:hypothetical protein